MPPTVPTSATGHKAAGPAAPVPNRDSGLALWRALHTSAMMTDAQILVKAVADLRAMCDQFAADHDANSIVRSLRAARVAARVADRGAHNNAVALASGLLKDVGGLAYALEVAELLISAELLGEPPADAASE